MKVSNPVQRYKPVTITLETQEEYDAVHDLLALSVGQMRAVGLERHYDEIESMFDALLGLED